MDEARENLNILNNKGQHLSANFHSSGMATGKLAILCPGYLDTKDYDHLVKLSGALVREGYDVIRFDPTGTWDSGGDISLYTTSQYLEDIRSVLEYMQKGGDYRHILLGGHSRGGQMSLLYAARDPRIDIVISIMGSSPRTLTRKKSSDWEQNGFSVSRRDIPGKADTKEYKVPYSHVLDRDKYNVIEDVRQIHVPVIFIAAEKDVLVLPEHVKELFNNANDPKKFVLIPNTGHDYRRNPEEIEIVNKEIIQELKALTNNK